MKYAIEFAVYGVFHYKAVVGFSFFTADEVIRKAPH